MPQEHHHRTKLWTEAAPASQLIGGYQDAFDFGVFERQRRLLRHGEPLIEIPADLYIPPDALEILLDAFHGPLDLLLYLIRKQNLDILDIPMAPLTRQYLEYVELMRTKNLELAAEYLVWPRR